MPCSRSRSRWPSASAGSSGGTRDPSGRQTRNSSSRTAVGGSSTAMDELKVSEYQINFRTCTITRVTRDLGAAQRRAEPLSPCDLPAGG